MCIYIYIYIYTCVCIYIYIYTYMYVYMCQRGGQHRLLRWNLKGGSQSEAVFRAFDRMRQYTRSPFRRFPSFRTQPLENLTPLPTNKWVPEQPSPWRKSSKRESCYGDRVYRMSRNRTCARSRGPWQARPLSKGGILRLGNLIELKFVDSSFSSLSSY